MKNKTFYISNTRIKRFDTTWRWEYDVKTITKDTIKFNGFNHNLGEDKTWYFNGTEKKTIPGTVSYTYYDKEHSDTTHETFEDLLINPENPNAPWLEYDGDSNKQWDGSHPLNTTRYLSPDISFLNPISIVSTVENVTIDTEPPKLIEDHTQYIVIGNSRRKFQYIFEEETAIDFKNFNIKLGNDYIYKCERKTNKIIFKDKILISVKLKSDGLHKYALEFIINSNECNAEQLNNDHLSIEVWDIAGNNAIYDIDRTFCDVNVDDLEDLEINFYNPVPQDRIISSHVDGEVWVDIYNPNSSIWEFFPIATTLGDGSIGIIDESTIDSSTYEDDGHIKFRIKPITARGEVVVNAWIAVDDEEWSKTIKSSTFIEGIDKPWILMADRNRLYDFKTYIPNVLKNTDFGDFIVFVEKFVNTYYLTADETANISALEKIARILDFNDIMNIEKEYLGRYSNELGNELDITFEDIMKMDTHFINESNSFEDVEFDDAVDEYRYIITNLPYYNQLKGSAKGMQMMLRIMGLCISFINLWLKTDKDIEENPEFIEESQLIDISNYFMSSYFMIDVYPNVDFRTFNDNVQYLLNIISSIKPLNRALQKIKYSVKYHDKRYLLQNIRSIKYTDTLKEYDISWNKENNSAELFAAFEEVNEQAKTANVIVIPDKNNVLYKFADKNINDILLTTKSNDGKITTFTIPIKNCKIEKIDSGIILTNLSGVAISNAYRIRLHRILGYDLNLHIKYLKGTDYIFSTAE